MLNNNIRIDLHIHSKASEYKEPKGYVQESNINNIDVLLSKLQENNINLISITDHNNFDYELYKKIRELINKTPYENVKKNLPGVEFDVKLEDESVTTCHIICIFDDSEEESIKNIQQNIEKIKKIENKDDYYTLDEFEKILYNIGISVLLIAHQKSDFVGTSSSKEHHSLSEAVEKPEEWIKTGLINALEYQKPRVQGMIKNNLKELNVKFATITGSDCHVWAAYPNKDDKVTETKDYFTKIKCLPTFKGLALSVTSPETRFERKDEGSLSNYINEIKIGDKTLELSTGINAIIGENGAGKSYVLEKIYGNCASIYSKINSINDIKISKVGNPQLTKISQGEIIDKVKVGKLLDNDSEYYDDIYTSNEFTSNITNFVASLKRYIDEKIKFKINEDIINNYKILIKEFNEVKNYYISLNIDVQTLDNVALNRYIAINKIYKDLYNENTTNSNYYVGTKKEKIDQILKLLLDLRQEIAKERDEVVSQNRIINIVTGIFRDVSEQIRLDRTSQENENEDMRTEMREFAVKIKEFLLNKDKEISFPVFPKAIEGVSVKSKYGFNFIKIAKYNNIELEDELYKFLFIQSYQSKEKIKNINTKDGFVNAVAGATTYEMIDRKLTGNVQKFIEEYTKEETSIKEENGTAEIGTTPGEVALTFYKLQLSKECDKDVILIDQPEDDISMKRIENYLINYFNNVRDKKQIIFVTHNPLLVVNLDVDNVINVTKDRKNIINIEAGCLEDSGVLEIVSDSLDGGKEVVERRLKIYGAN